MRPWFNMPTAQTDRLSDHLPPGVTMRRFLVTAYGPSLLVSFGFGAVIPMLVIEASALGANAGLAAFVAALVGIGQVLGDLPAGVVADRFGERRALAGACLVDAVALGSVFFVHHLLVFAIIVFVHGMTGSVFGLARQTYLTVAVPIKWRARAMSSLGGVFRVGSFLGPLVGALIIQYFGLSSVFLLAGAMSVVAAFVTLMMPDTPTPEAATGCPDAQRVGVWTVLRAHRHTLLTIGWGVLAMTLVRAARQTLIPLWCDASGIAPATTNLIYAASMGAEVLLFFPGGIVMDRLGRWWVTVPTMIIMGAGFVALPLADSVLMITALGLLLGIGNGLSSGIVSTLGADVSPPVGRPQFLAGWRVFCDVGTSIGPLVISVVTALATLGASAVALALIGWLGAVQLGRCMPRSGQLPPSEPRP
ncbi:MAG: MFS transporter [Propionibacteriaceae bacterium]|nr:MFS transporter [Propionibacteriaceae bacterium]